MPPAFYLYEDHHQDGEGLDEDTDWETFEAVASC